ncbi:hypothetical protein ACPCSP_25800 [Streptomyces cinereoruber]|uniref:hypothetical protein n=1 Tax=Streptomyces cinereoruber TaxID=67260 RepID=UPI003C2CDF2C
MSARITLRCDREWRDGSCPRQLPTLAATVDDARQYGALEHWTHHGGRDYCPLHGGPTGRTATVRLDIAPQNGDTPS